MQRLLLLIKITPLYTFSKENNISNNRSDKRGLIEIRLSGA